MNLILIEDDPTISLGVKTYLENHGMATDCFSDLKSAMDVSIDNYDLLILDVNLPDGSGFDYLNYLREFSTIPVIMLTVKGEEGSILKEFSSGANDYVTKPFSLAVLKARIDNIFRQSQSHYEELTCGLLSLDIYSKTVFIDHESINCNRQEYELIRILLENSGLNISRGQLIDFVWGGTDEEINDNTLTVSIKRLREKLGDYGKCIKTVRGIGYTWDENAYED